MPEISRFLGGMLSVTKAEHLGDYKIRLTFSDGKSSVADLSDTIRHQKPFAPLIDTAQFARFTVDYTIAWSNGLDLAPEYLYFKAFQNEPALQPLFEKWGYVSSHAA